MALKPTCFLRWVRRDKSAPSRVLQQWWTNWASRDLHEHPDNCRTGGEWRDIEMQDEFKSGQPSIPSKPSAKADIPEEDF